MPPTVSNVGPLVGALWTGTRAAGMFPFRVVGAAYRGGTATSVSGGTGLFSWIESLFFNGNNALRGSSIIPNFWAAVKNLNFSGSGLGTAFRALSGSGYAILGLTALAGVIGVGMAISNLIADYKDLNDASHERPLGLIGSVPFFLGKAAADVGMGSGFVMMLAGNSVGAIPILIASGLGMVGAKVIEWFNSPSNPALTGGATIPFPFNYILKPFFTNSTNMP